ncbi:hypothetical protein [Streptomyces sp. NPDC056492]|uniref:hypothetical protein n=1 Tax=unclassified Streptomyces TaxID=2593676 RepID=UPI00369242D8
MDVARLVLDYLKVLIWPATTLAIVYGFRGQFRDLIRRVRVLSGPGIDAEFSERVLEASEDAEEAVLSHPPAEEPEDPEPAMPGSSGNSSESGEESAAQSRGPTIRGYYRMAPDGNDALMSLADSHPSAAVVAAFIGVESELRRLATTELPASASFVSTRQLARQLPFPDDIKTSILEMSHLRNSAAHGAQAVSTRAARAFIRSSRELIDWLQAFGDQPRLF